MMSTTEQNYLRIIYEILFEKKSTATTGKIADITHTKPASVTEMIKKMAKKDLLQYQAYKGVKLTDKGKKIALDVIRKYRIWETYLVHEMDYGWDEVSEIADETEHLENTNLIKKMDKILNYPRFNPFGEAIPKENGHIEPLSFTALSAGKPGDQVKIMGITERDPILIKSLDLLGLSPQKTFKVIDKEIFTGNINISIDGKTQTITADFAKMILVHKKNNFLKIF